MTHKKIDLNKIFKKVEQIKVKTPKDADEILNILFESIANKCIELELRIEKLEKKV